MRSMKSLKKSSRVSAKVDAVLTLFRTENPGASISVSVLARKAGVSRSNLYESHPDLVASLRQESRGSRPRRTHSTDARLAELCNQLTEVRRVNKALLLMNVELNQEIIRLRRRLAWKQGDALRASESH